MKVHRNVSIDRLMSRRLDKMARSEMFKNYLKNASKTKKSELFRVMGSSGVCIELSEEAKSLMREKHRFRSCGSRN